METIEFKKQLSEIFSTIANQKHATLNDILKDNSFIQKSFEKISKF